MFQKSPTVPLYCSRGILTRDRSYLTTTHDASNLTVEGPSPGPGIPLPPQDMGYGIPLLVTSGGHCHTAKQDE